MIEKLPWRESVYVLDIPKFFGILRGIHLEDPLRKSPEHKMTCPSIDCRCHFFKMISDLKKSQRLDLCCCWSPIPEARTSLPSIVSLHFHTVFGNPKIGVAALSQDPMAALDLPAKILVYGSESGTKMAYEVPSEMLAEWNIPADAPILQAMAKTLDRVATSAAN